MKLTRTLPALVAIAGLLAAMAVLASPRTAVTADGQLLFPAELRGQRTTMDLRPVMVTVFEVVGLDGTVPPEAKGCYFTGGVYIDEGRLAMRLMSLHSSRGRFLGPVEPPMRDGVAFEWLESAGAYGAVLPDDEANPTEYRFSLITVTKNGDSVTAVWREGVMVPAEAGPSKWVIDYSKGYLEFHIATFKQRRGPPNSPDPPPKKA